MASRVDGKSYKELVCNIYANPAQKNQERVWAEEKKALEERKLIQQLQKERQEERNLQDIQELAEASGAKVSSASCYNGNRANRYRRHEERG